MVGVLQESCGRCGHAFSFHGRTDTKPCKAIGCNKGPNGWTCPGFVLPDNASTELRESLSAPA